MPVAGLAVALTADQHRAQARFVEEGLGRGVRAARGGSPRVQPGSLLSVFDGAGQLGLLGRILNTWPGSFTTFSRPIRPAESCADDGALGSWRCDVR